MDIAVDERLAFASTLPATCYTDPRVQDEERGKVFGRTWQLVGRAADVAEAGQYFSTVVAGEPVVVVRGEEGRLRALSNVCRHRAGPVTRGAGICRGGRLRCGYHGWSYGLDGQLQATPEFEGVECFRKDEVRLPEFRVATWLGLVFVQLDAAAPALAAVRAEVDTKVAGRGLAEMQFAHRKEWEIACNWKTYVDNYLEAYHLPVVHPGLMQSLDYANYSTTIGAGHSLQRSPLRGTSDERDEALYFWIYPNLMINVYPDNYSTNLILPIAPERTLTIFEWYFRDPEATRVASTVGFSDEIQREDIAVCEAVQRGLRSRTYERGRYSVKRESGVHHFHRLFADAMR